MLACQVRGAVGDSSLCYCVRVPTVGWFYTSTVDLVLCQIVKRTEVCLGQCSSRSVSDCKENRHLSRSMFASVRYENATTRCSVFASGVELC